MHLEGSCEIGLSAPHMETLPLLVGELVQFAGDPKLQKEWMLAKKTCKQKLAAYIGEKTGYTVDPNSMFDVQVCTPLKHSEVL